MHDMEVSAHLDAVEMIPGCICVSVSTPDEVDHSDRAEELK